MKRMVDYDKFIKDYHQLSYEDERALLCATEDAYTKDEVNDILKKLKEEIVEKYETTGIKVYNSERISFYLNILKIIDNTINSLKDDIKSTPTIEAKWILRKDTKNNDWIWVCNHCEISSHIKQPILLPKVCPNCKAKMMNHFCMENAEEANKCGDNCPHPYSDYLECLKCKGIITDQERNVNK